MAQPILIYTMATCPFCIRAKDLLRSKGLAFEEVNLEEQEERWGECERRSGRETVPQVFVGDRHLGGCDDLLSLDASGELDALLRG